MKNSEQAAGGGGLWVSILRTFISPVQFLSVLEI